MSLFSLHAQDEQKENAASPFVDFVLQKNEPSFESVLKLPIINFSTGIFTFHGDVESSFSKNLTNGTPAFQIDFEQNINEYYNFGVKYLRGKIYGVEHIPNSNIRFDFQTQISSFGAYVHYNFGDFTRLPQLERRKLSPYINVGLEFLQSPEPWGDFYNDSIQLFQWKDGSLRNIEENLTTSSNSEIVYRDYKYETSYHRENIDNLEGYSPLVMSIPIEIGASLKLDPHVTLNIGYQYHIALSNQLDNIGREAQNYNNTPERKGNVLPDGFSYAYLSLSYNFGYEKHDMYENDTLDSEVAFYEFWDEDGDGVDETIDECPYTPKGVKVQGNGCPVDLDNDNIPDYKDVEQKQGGFYVDPSGKSYTEKEMKERMYGLKPIPQDEIYRFYAGLLDGGTVFKQFYKRIPSKFKPIDLDKDQYINIDELLYAIDSFFDEGPEAGAGANLQVKDLFDLIEFFFLQ